ncbi:MAG: hypothetical protein IJS47_01485 [Clostridia bacterium]|nr:hypothetical protein [Clostridia bacterium]
MIKLMKYKRIFIIASVLILLFSAVVYAAVTPGSADDPLITLSYFNEKFDEKMEEFLEELKDYLEEKLDTDKEPEKSASATFELINIKAGSILVCGEGTEFIIRTGKMDAVASSSGGLSDVTSGENIAGGVPVPLNHHIVIPRNDGRGLNVLIGGAVMIRGEYDIIEE